jgi:hypothetical protein
MSRAIRLMATLLAAACCGVQAARAAELPTTYGEDPVPDIQCYPGYIELGYGVDPIPAKTLAERWRAWRAARVPKSNVSRRTSGGGAYPAVGQREKPRTQGPQVLWRR